MFFNWRPANDSIGISSDSFQSLRCSMLFPKLVLFAKVSVKVVSDLRTFGTKNRVSIQSSDLFAAA